jgi:hypothetical protein
LEQSEASQVYLPGKMCHKEGGGGGREKGNKEKKSTERKKL